MLKIFFIIITSLIGISVIAADSSEAVNLAVYKLRNEAQDAIISSVGNIEYGLKQEKPDNNYLIKQKAQLEANMQKYMANGGSWILKDSKKFKDRLDAVLSKMDQQLKSSNVAPSNADFNVSCGVKETEHGKFPHWDLTSSCKNCYWTMDEIYTSKDGEIRYYSKSSNEKNRVMNGVFADGKSTDDVDAYSTRTKKVVHFNPKICSAFNDPKSCISVNPNLVIVQDYEHGTCQKYSSMAEYQKSQEQDKQFKISCSMKLGVSKCSNFGKVIAPQNMQEISASSVAPAAPPAPKANQ